MNDKEIQVYPDLLDEIRKLRRESEEMKKAIQEKNFHILTLKDENAALKARWEELKKRFNVDDLCSEFVNVVIGEIESSTITFCKSCGCMTKTIHDEEIIERCEKCGKEKSGGDFPVCEPESLHNPDRVKSGKVAGKRLRVKRTPTKAAIRKPVPITICNECHCMTKTKDSKCPKCGHDKSFGDYLQWEKEEEKKHDNL